MNVGLSGNTPVEIHVLRNRGAREIRGADGEVSSGKQMDRIRLAALPLLGVVNGGRWYDFAGFVETKDTSWFHRFWEKLCFDHITFDAFYTDAKGKRTMCTAWVRVESVRKRLGIGKHGLSFMERHFSLWRRDLIWTRYFLPVLHACGLKQHGLSSEMGPEERFAWARLEHPEEESNPLSMAARKQILQFVEGEWYDHNKPGILSTLQRGFSEGNNVVSIDIAKGESGLPYDLLVLAYKKTPESPMEWDLYVIQDKAGQVEEKEVFPVIDFYSPKAHLFITKEGPAGSARHEDAVLHFIGEGAPVSWPIVRFDTRALYSVDDELKRLRTSPPLLFESPSQKVGDLIHVVDTLHHHGGGVFLGAFNPVIYYAQGEDERTIDRCSLLGLEYATTPGMRRADPVADRAVWGNPLYWAPEVAEERQKRNTAFDSAAETIGKLKPLRIRGKLVNPDLRLDKMAFIRARDEFVKMLDTAQGAIERARADAKGGGDAYAIAAVEGAIAKLADVERCVEECLEVCRKTSSIRRMLKNQKEYDLRDAREALESVKIELSKYKAKNPFSESSDMWTLGLRLLDLLRNPSETPCAEVRAFIAVGLAREDAEKQDKEPVDNWVKKPESDADIIRMIARMDGDLMEPPADRRALEYLAYLMTRGDPKERITAREALRRYYGIVIHRIATEMQESSEKYPSLEFPKEWEPLRQDLLREVDHNLLGRDMRKDRLSEERVLGLIKRVNALYAQDKTGYLGITLNELCVCLWQLFNHPREERERGSAGRGRRGL